MQKIVKSTAPAAILLSTLINTANSLPAENQPRRMLGIWGLGRYAKGWNTNMLNWDDDRKWCLYVGTFIVVYCTLALLCLMASRCFKGGRNREVHTNEEVTTNTAGRAKAYNDVVVEETVHTRRPKRPVVIEEEQVIVNKRNPYNSGYSEVLSGNGGIGSVVRNSRYSERSQPNYEVDMYRGDSRVY